MISIVPHFATILHSSRDARKAAVRAEMEAKASGKRKKGFMTPERKKKLRVSCSTYRYIYHPSIVCSKANNTCFCTRCLVDQ